MNTWLTWSFLAWCALAMGLHLPLMYIYIQHILPTLDKHGKRAVWAMSRGAIQKQIAEYGEICRAQGLSTRRYRYARLLTSNKVAALWIVSPLAYWVAMELTSRR